jgi:hypothetical protein
VRSEPAAPQTAVGWWYARYRVHWPQEAQPRWHLDLMLAHEVVAPVLERYQPVIRLWRFHRRAVRDQTGHQFSFIFYTDPESARRIFNTLQLQPRLQELKRAGLIDQDSYDDTQRIARPHLQDTSDQQWSPALQRAWPWFIMGVSATWLDLIRQSFEGEDRGKLEAPLSVRAGHYRQVDDAIIHVWQMEGAHAFLHHLNALFEYESLMVLERRSMQF